MDQKEPRQDESEHARDTIFLLRTTQQHHVQLSAMADHKASILIGACFVVLAILFGQMSAGGISIPIYTLSGTTLLSAFFAVLAVIPRGVATPRDRRDLNPLFFGHFSGLSEEEFLEEMEKVCADDRTVHRAMSRDIYWMGRVLYEKKFRYLQWSYVIFIVGLALTLVGTVALHVAAGS